jgi:hypothetical protein
MGQPTVMSQGHYMTDLNHKQEQHILNILGNRAFVPAYLRSSNDIVYIHMVIKELGHNPHLVVEIN